MFVADTEEELDYHPASLEESQDESQFSQVRKKRRRIKKKKSSPYEQGHWSLDEHDLYLSFLRMNYERCIWLHTSVLDLLPNADHIIKNLILLQLSKENTGQKSLKLRQLVMRLPQTKCIWIVHYYLFIMMSLNSSCTQTMMTCSIKKHRDFHVISNENYLLAFFEIQKSIQNNINYGIIIAINNTFLSPASIFVNDSNLLDLHSILLEEEQKFPRKHQRQNLEEVCLLLSGFVKHLRSF